MTNRLLLSTIYLTFLSAFFVWRPVLSKDVKTIDYGIIRYVKGKVELVVSKDGKEVRKEVGPMERFYDGNTIITGETSFAILKLPDGSTMKLEPQSNLKVEGLMQKSGENYKGTSYFVLSVGGVMVDVVKKFSGPPTVEIETLNNVSFGVRGTTFYIFHDQETSDVWGVVKKGNVMVMDYLKDDSEEITEGNAVAVVEGQLITKPHSYKWMKKIKWSFRESESELDTGRMSSVSERYQELQSIFPQLKRRSRNKFKEQREQENPEAFRTSIGEIPYFGDIGGGNGSIVSGGDSGILPTGLPNTQETKTDTVIDGPTTPTNPPDVTGNPGKTDTKTDGEDGEAKGGGNTRNELDLLAEACKKIDPQVILRTDPCTSVTGLTDAWLNIAQVKDSKGTIYFCCYPIQKDGNLINEN